MLQRCIRFMQRTIVGLALIGLPLLLSCGGAPPDVQLGGHGGSTAALSTASFTTYNVLDPAATIEVLPLGRYVGGYYSGNTPASPPAYDPLSNQIYNGSGDRHTIEAIDLSDPTSPQLAWAFDVSPWGDDPAGLATAKGLVAASVTTSGNVSAPAYVLILNSRGELVADPIELPDANKIEFVGKTLVVTLPGYPNDAYTIDPEGGVAFIDLGPLNWGGCNIGRAHCNIRSSVEILRFFDLNDQKAALEAQGLRFATPGSTVSQDLEIESLAISADGKEAWLTFERNNGIGLLDLRARKLVDLWTAGSRDHMQPGHGFDASDADNRINIANWPVISLAEPDTIAEYSFRGQRFVVVANEGDPRDSPGFSEKVRVRDRPLDPISIPNGSFLRDRARLGRLQVTTHEGDPDRDGDLDRLVMLGSRSFSIFTEKGKLVYDSGDFFEQMMAATHPSYFNTAEDENIADARSDDRGPEIEHLTLGKVGDRTYAFMGFERSSGIMVFDITNPAAVKFQQYLNLRNFEINPKQVCGPRGAPAPAACIVGDNEPEGIKFVPACDSPTGEPLLIINHELSDTVAVYQINHR